MQNLINARYKLHQDESDFLILTLKNMAFGKIDANENSDLKLIKKIMTKFLEIPTKDGFCFINWFEKISVDEENKKIYFSFQNDVKNFFLDLQKDLSIEDIKTFISLSNNYSRAIYKLLKVHQHKKKAKINLEDLKSRLEIPKSHDTYSNFKIKVLNVAQDELKEFSDISFEVSENKDGKKVSSLVFEIFSSSSDTKEITQEIKNLEVVEIKDEKPISLKGTEDAINDDIKRIVTFFDQERKKIQPNYFRRESKNIDAQYLLRMHLKESGRTPQMFFDAIRWLFSNNPKAAFHRDYIMNIGKLIEHFNALEHQAVFSQDAVEFNEEAQSWYNVLKKQGLNDEEILRELREGGYIK